MGAESQSDRLRRLLLAPWSSGSYCRCMVVSVVFETHSWSEDNDCGIATGWHHGRLSSEGRHLAGELGDRRSDDGIDIVFTSDLRRAVETAEIAFAGTDTPILHDWRLRECNYGAGNGMPAAQLHRNKARYITTPYPEGESWTRAVERVGWFLDDMTRHADGQRILVVGHVATYWGIVHCTVGTPVADLIADGFDWKLGWEFELTGSVGADRCR